MHPLAGGYGASTAIHISISAGNMFAGDFDVAS